MNQVGKDGPSMSSYFEKVIFPGKIPGLHLGRHSTHVFGSLEWEEEEDSGIRSMVVTFLEAASKKHGQIKCNANLCPVLTLI